MDIICVYGPLHLPQLTNYILLLVHLSSFAEASSTLRYTLQPPELLLRRSRWGE